LPFERPRRANDIANLMGYKIWKEDAEAPRPCFLDELELLGPAPREVEVEDRLSVVAANSSCSLMVSKLRLMPNEETWSPEGAASSKWMVSIK